ncbi:HprK-related kinase A [Thiobacter aerophilum]|uniref:HprK-related kinase A n=1 Tax=Thiobacter aerophilum TaxID=3121275 RepID=A0ABV0EI83_9BURK
MNLRELPLEDIRHRLAGPGLCLRTGPFTVRIRSRISAVVDSLTLLYADHPVLADEVFCDFHVRLLRPLGLRRWWRPQVKFAFDDFVPFKPLPYDHAFPMLEWGLNWSVAQHAHWYLVVHAAVIEQKGRAAILPAPPGSGKSTLTAALVQRGWRLLSDELTLIDPETGLVHALARPVSLKNTSLPLLRAWAPEAVFGPPAHDTLKGTVAHMKPPQESVARMEEPAHPAWVIFPRYVPDSAPRLTPHPRAHALLELAHNAFNYSALGSCGYDTLARLIATVECFDFTYSRLEDALNIFTRLADGP